MTQQEQQLGSAASAVAPLRTLKEWGDEGIRRGSKVDLTALPFPVSPWYERYWYGDGSPSTWGILGTTARWLRREVPRVGSEMARAVTYLDLSHNPLDQRDQR
jgi:hypothetical protein